MKYQINVYSKFGLLFSVESSSTQMKDLSSTKKVFGEIRNKFKKYQGFKCEVKEFGPEGIKELNPEKWERKA